MTEFDVDDDNMDWQFKVRKWDEVFSAWIDSGQPETNPEAPKPGDHPDPNSLWNISPEAYLAKCNLVMEMDED